MKDRDGAQAQCGLDIALFTQYFAPHFGITRRYAGTEPLSPLTARYNEALKAHLPPQGIQVREIPRLCTKDTPISATTARSCIEKRDWDRLNILLPKTTIGYIKNTHL